MKNAVIGLVTLLFVFAGVSQGAFTWNGTSNLAGTQVYDGTGVDSSMNPLTIGATTSNNYIGVGNTGQLDVISGTLTWINGNPGVGRNAGGNGTVNVSAGATLNIKDDGTWGSSIGHNSGVGTVHVEGTLSWTLSGNNEQRFMVGNQGTAAGTININGGTFNLLLDPTEALDDDQRCFRVGCENTAQGTLNLNAGVLNYTAAIPFGLGGKWTGMNSTPAFAAVSNEVGTINIIDGDFIMSGSNKFAVGTNGNVNFITGGFGSLSILNWTTADFLALATSGKLQVDGVDVPDLTGFTVVNGGSGAQGVLSLQTKIKYLQPANRSVNVLTNQALSWTVNEPAVAFVDLYFGTDPNWVGNPTEKKLSMAPATTVSYDTGTMAYSTVYYWRVDAYEPNTAPGATDYFKTAGSVWSFTTVGQAPVVSAVVPPISMVAGDGTANVSMSVTATNVDAYQWYKIGNPTDTMLTNGAKYAGVTTNTLTINGVVPADEGYYYCQVTNTVYPDPVNNKTTGPGRLLTRRLVSYYPMETDASGVTPDVVSGLNMTLMGEGTAGLATLSAGVPELGGNGLLFSNGDHATDPNGQYAMIGAGVVDYHDITIAVWVKWNGGVNWQRILDFGNDTTHYMFLTPSNGTQARFVMKNGGDEQIVSTSPLSTGQWVHVAATLGANTGRLYINGELVATNANVTIDPTDFNPTVNYIGKSQWAADPEFDGTLDDLKIYNYARTTAEIAQDYLAVKGGWVCNKELAAIPYDYDGNCQVDLGDLAIFAATWLDSNRIYQNP